MIGAHPVPSWCSSSAMRPECHLQPLQQHTHAHPLIALLPPYSYCTLCKATWEVQIHCRKGNGDHIAFICHLHAGAKFCKAGAVPQVTHSFLLWHSSNFLVSWINRIKKKNENKEGFVVLSRWSSFQGIRDAPTEGWGQSQPVANSSREVGPQCPGHPAQPQH